MENRYKDVKQWWEDFEVRIDNLSKNQRINFNDIEKNKGMGLFCASFLNDTVLQNILAGNYDKAMELSKLGEIYAGYALEKGQREYLPGKKADVLLAGYMQNVLLYRFRWINNKLEDLNSLQNAFEFIKKAADESIGKKSPKSKVNCLGVVTVGLKLGEFKTVEYYFNYTYKRNKKQKQDMTVVYDKLLFYSYIVEYLCDRDHKSHLKPFIEECFTYYYDELLKGNMDLIKAYNMFDERVEMAYLAYKYFSSYEWSQVEPVRIIRSIREGIQ